MRISQPTTCAVIHTDALDFMANYNKVLVGDVHRELADGIRKTIFSGVATGKSAKCIRPAPKARALCTVGCSECYGVCAHSGRIGAFSLWVSRSTSSSMVPGGAGNGAGVMSRLSR